MLVFRAIWNHRSIVFAVLIMVFIVAFVVYGTVTTANTADQEGLRIAERAINRNVMQCYALEGAYPPSMEYLEENYAMDIDKDRFIVIYTYRGTNVIPQIVIELRQEQ